MEKKKLAKILKKGYFLRALWAAATAAAVAETEAATKDRSFQLLHLNYLYPSDIKVGEKTFKFLSPFLSSHFILSIYFIYYLLICIGR